MKRVYNFSAGPAILPVSALEKAQKELLNYNSSGMSVMELSHRSSLFKEIIEETEDLLRNLMNIPDNYQVLFLQGGATLQFSMLPMNLAIGKKACYIHTGNWSKKAIAEAKKIENVQVEVVASSEDKNFTYIPTLEPNALPSDAAYLHITTNNTIEGTSYYTLPETGDVPLVADMSSNILSVNYNVSDFGVIYAGAQKNLGIAGVTVVIIREDLIGLNPTSSAMLDYKTQADANSLYNTPPTFPIYMMKLVLEWVKEQGGVNKMQELNKEKSAILYQYLASSKLFTSPVAEKDRSLNNVPFLTSDPELNAQFIKEAQLKGFENIKGHKSVGGMRASLYNAFPIEGVTALVQFMEEFKKRK